MRFACKVNYALLMPGREDTCKEYEDRDEFLHYCAVVYHTGMQSWLGVTAQPQFHQQLQCLCHPVLIIRTQQQRLAGYTCSQVGTAETRGLQEGDRKVEQTIGSGTGRAGSNVSPKSHGVGLGLISTSFKYRIP